jgi:hypothetical protein
MRLGKVSLIDRAYRISGQGSRLGSKAIWKRGIDTVGGDRGARTPDLLHAMQALSQLSYIPTFDRLTLRL